MRDVTLAILAGGEGSRMGVPKGELRIGDEPILSYLLRQIAWQGPTMLVTAPGRERPAGHERFDREVVDPVAGLGPLRGLLTAVENTTTPLVVVATVDMPGVRHEQLVRLIEHLSARPASTGVMFTRDGQIEPFPSAWRTTSVDVIRARVDGGRLSVRAAVDEASVDAVAAPPEWSGSVWTNLNRPADLDEFLRSRAAAADAAAADAAAADDAADDAAAAD
jgi:molybdopterin-guanine dinucleotide biosynthesis protein A